MLLSVVRRGALHLSVGPDGALHDVAVHVLEGDEVVGTTAPHLMLDELVEVGDAVEHVVAVQVGDAGLVGALDAADAGDPGDGGDAGALEVFDTAVGVDAADEFLHLDLALDQAQTGLVETFVVIESHDDFLEKCAYARKTKSAGAEAGRLVESESTSTLHGADAKGLNQQVELG
jgi:hypothetical protein